MVLKEGEKNEGSLTDPWVDLSSLARSARATTMCMFRGFPGLGTVTCLPRDEAKLFLIVW